MTGLLNQNFGEKEEFQPVSDIMIILIESFSKKMKKPERRTNTFAMEIYHLK